jgi:hypothetical protein
MLGTRVSDRTSFETRQDGDVDQSLDTPHGWGYGTEAAGSSRVDAFQALVPEVARTAGVDTGRLVLHNLG